MSKENKVEIYEAPIGAKLQKDYIVKVRAIGEDTWQQVPTYQVKVDMHDVREASMVYFDFEGKVEVEISFPKFYTVYQVDIRPLDRNIKAEFEDKKIFFTLDKPENLSIEINKDRFHNLHLFAGAIEAKPVEDNVVWINGYLGDDLNERITALPEGRIVYIKAGMHYVTECVWHIPSNTQVYFEGGAVLIGGLICDGVRNVKIYGRGILYMANFERFSGTNGLRISDSENIELRDLIFINPPHYTVHLGGSKDIGIYNIKSFSCEGWSDGIDMMSCQRVTVDGGFLRTSDDCVAIYGSRWRYRGDSKNIVVKNISVWADVAHALMIGTHGDYEKEGDIIENVVYENIDILEHHEFQKNYLGALAINVGDKNTARNILYKNIRIEPFEHGKVLDFQVKWNKDYNPAPGRKIEAVRLEEIYIRSGSGEEKSVIQGYSEGFNVEDIHFTNIYRDNKLVKSIEEANIDIGPYVKDVYFDEKYDI